MEKTFALTERQALRIKLWPIGITLCGLFLIGAYEASTFSIVSAALASGFSWWFYSRVPLSITFRDDGNIQFKSLSKTMEISAQNIHTIYEDGFFRDIAVLHSGGRIAVQTGMPNVLDFIETARKHNPSIEVRLKHAGRRSS
jgi:hypothetical protein